VELGKGFASEFLECLEDLDKLGMEVSYLGGTSFAIHSIPVWLESSDLMDFALNLEKEWQEGASLPTRGGERMEFLMIRMACHGAVKAHQTMKDPEIRRLLEDLDALEISSHCPHGRPVWIRLDLRELEKRFARIP